MIKTISNIHLNLMDKRKYFIIFLVLVQSIFIFAEDTFEYAASSGDTLYVWAETGLNIRAYGNQEAEILGVIPFGNAIIFVDHDNSGRIEEVPFYQHSAEISIINGIDFKCLAYSQKGRWIKIKFGSLVGFVFNGYTSRYKPIKGETSILHLIEHNVNLISTTEHYDEKQDCSSKYMHYNKGISIIGNLCKSGNWTYVFPNMTLEEAILFSRKNIEYQFKYILPEGNVCLYETVLDKESNVVSIKFTNNTNWFMQITYTSDAIIISESVWC